MNESRIEIVPAINIYDVNKRLTEAEARLSELEQNYSKLLNLINFGQEATDDTVKTSYAWIVNEWNTELSPLGVPKITSIAKKRHKLVSARIKEYGKDSFHKCIEEVKQSSFLQGKTKNPWTGFSFDWMILPNNFPKVLEGNYNDSRKKEQTNSTYNNSSIPDSWIS